MSVPTPTLSPNPWLRILDALEKKINRHSYDTWLKPTRYSHSSNGIMYVRVPTADFRHVQDKYADLIQEALDNLNMDYQDVEFVTPDNDPAATPVRHDGGLSTPAPVAPSAHLVSQARFDWDGAAQLNPRYTFDAFVIGSGNQFAHAACQAVSQRPSKAYNPLFLYGGVGMGKTHLMQAIGHEVKRMQPQAAICYISSEKFTNEMINSLRYDKMTSSSLIGAEITLPYTQQVLKNFIDSQARKVTIESIQKAVAEQFGLRLVEIKAKNNSRAIVYPRQIAMYLAKHLTEASLPEIGRQFGGKHHTTVLHSVEKIEETRKGDKDLNRLLTKLTEQLGG